MGITVLFAGVAAADYDSALACTNDFWDARQT
jgi:hypothetical protein